MPSPELATCPPSLDPTTLLLRRLFANALRLSVLSAAAAGGGCEMDDWPSKSDGFEPVSCAPVADLTPAEPIDYIALRETHDYQQGQYTELDAWGTACATAGDKAACERELESTADLTGNNIGIDHQAVRYVTSTRGDDVRRFASPDALLPVLGAVDAPNEAVLLVRLAGYTVDCEQFQLAAVRARGDGYEVVGTKMTMSCDPIENTKFLLRVSESGEIAVRDQKVYERQSACVGRRPAGLVAARPQQALRDLGQFFAGVAQLEAASVHAFRVLARELCALGAPHVLVRGARRAARDEVRHARLTAALARRFGAVPVPPRIAPQALRAAFALALDNAVEGCVRETFGALFGSFQAAHARDFEVRRCMRAIAEDETRHASLAWQIAAWLEPRLSAQERAELRTAQRQAVVGLAEELEGAADTPALQMLAGVPSRAQAQRLLAALRTQLWPTQRAA